LDQNDLSALVADLNGEIKLYSSRNLDRSSCALYRFLELLQTKSKAHKPRYGVLGLNLLPFAKIYKQSLVERFPDDSDDEYTKILSERISGLISNAKRGEETLFTKALFHCVWEQNSDLGIFATDPLERNDLPVSEWIKGVREQIRAESSKFHLCDSEALETNKLPDNIIKSKLLFLQYKYPPDQESETISKLKDQLNDALIATDCMLLDTQNVTSFFSDFVKIRNEERIDFAVLAISPRMIKKLFGNKDVQSNFQSLIAEKNDIGLALIK
jgi:hypothetical protein